MMPSKLSQPREWPTAQLADEILRHNRLYFAEAAPEISDAAFDALVAELRRREPNHTALRQVGTPPPVAEAEKVTHKRPMLSLEKCNTPDEFNAWLRGICATLTGKPNNAKALPPEDVAAWAGQSPQAWLVLTPKIDGLACAIHYDADGKLKLAATRGDGEVGENVTHSLKQVGGVPNALTDGLFWPHGELEVRGEVYLPLSAFQTVADQFANPRNLAAGVLKAKENPALAPSFLRFFAYDVLGPELPTETAKLALLARLGFTPAPHARIRPTHAHVAFAQWVERRPTEDFEADGVVLKLDDATLAARLGLTAHHPRNAIAWKFIAESGLTTLLDVEWSVARTGTITPVAIVAPVQLSGAAVSRATLHNVSNLRRLGLQIGDTVELVRRGGVIPHVENTKGGGHLAIVPPVHCPSCGSPTRLDQTLNKATGKTTELLACTTPEQCIASRSRKLLHFCATLELDGFGEKVIDALLAAGLVTDAADLYTLQAGDLEELPRVGKILAQKLVSEVARARVVDLALFLRALGIETLGKHAAMILADRWTFDELRRLEVAEIAELHSLGEITAQQIVVGLREQAALIDRLLVHVRLERRASQVGEGPLAGQVIVFTGTLTRMKRSDAQARVVKLGGLAGDSVTAETTTLVVGADELDSATPSSKLKKARKLRETGDKPAIVGEAAFWQKLEVE